VASFVSGLEKEQRPFGIDPGRGALELPTNRIEAALEQGTFGDAFSDRDPALTRPEVPKRNGKVER
jgi:hypothetical protein